MNDQISELILKYHQKAKSLRSDTLVSMHEGIINERIADILENEVIPDLHSLLPIPKPQKACYK